MKIEIKTSKNIENTKTGHPSYSACIEQCCLLCPHCLLHTLSPPSKSLLYNVKPQQLPRIVAVSTYSSAVPTLLAMGFYCPLLQITTHDHRNWSTVTNVNTLETDIYLNCIWNVISYHVKSSPTPFYRSNGQYSNNHRRHSKLKYAEYLSVTARRIQLQQGLKRLPTKCRSTIVSLETA